VKLAVNRVVKGWRSPNEFTPPAQAYETNPVGYGRRFLRHTDAPLAENAFSAFGLRMDAPEPMFGHMIGNNFADGAFVHPHTDPAPKGFAHVRCNWMIKKPAVGGDPILDGEVVPVSEGDLWLCIASHERHSTTPIHGGERIIYSFGALVGLEQLRPLIAESTPCPTPS
jgi:hypothetical protein